MSEDQINEDGLWDDSSSIYRPSYSATWLNCAGSLRPSRWAPDTAGIDAARGTVFHLLMADWLVNGRPDHRLGEIVIVEGFDIVIDEEMFYHGSRIVEQYENFEGERFIEVSVDISDITPIKKQKGTADLVIIQPGLLRTIDHKYGSGVQVFAEGNTQELLYCWGVFLKYDSVYHFKTIELHIAQPRFNHFDVWTITREELISWADWMRERAHAAWKRSAPRTPSPKACQWCKVIRGCSALAIKLADIADQSFDDAEITEADMKTSIALNAPLARKTLPDPLSLPTENLAKIRDYRKMFESWFRACDEELLTRALAGEDPPGWKVVEGRSRRRYRDEKVAAEKYGRVGLTEDEIYARKIISPAQAEKLLRFVGIRGNLLKAFVSTLTERPKGRPTLAPDGDNRLAVPNVVDDVFDSEAEDAL